MDSNFSAFAKGMAAGVAVGAAISLATKPMDYHKRNSFSKNAEKTMRAFGDIIQNAQNLIK